MPPALPPPVVPGTRQRRKDARPSELLDAALDLFVEKGFALTRIEEVAQRAGVSKGTLYLYYASKEELMQAVIHQHLGSAIAAGAAEIDAHAGPMADVLTELLPRWWLGVYDSPASGVFKLVVTELRNFPDLAEFYAAEVVQPGEALIARVIRRGVERGEFRAVHVPSAVHSLLLPMVMLCMHKHSLGACVTLDPPLDGPRFIHEHMALMLAALQTPPLEQPRRGTAAK